MDKIKTIISALWNGVIEAIKTKSSLVSIASFLFGAWLVFGLQQMGKQDWLYQITYFFLGVLITILILWLRRDSISPKGLQVWLGILAWLLVTVVLIMKVWKTWQTPHDLFVEAALEVIVTYFVFHSVFSFFEQNELIEKTDNTLNDLIKSIGVMKVIESPDEYYRMLKGAMDEATDSILLIYLTSLPPQDRGKTALDYWEWFHNFAVRKGDHLTIKRIASLNNEEKKNWLVQHTTDLAQVSLYGLRCYLPDNNFPLLGLEIIDRKEVFLFGPHSQSSTWLHVKNENIGYGMAAYFDALWDRLKEEKYRLKDIGKTTDCNQITQKLNILLPQNTSSSPEPPGQNPKE
jgi:hypothetical protein